MRKVNEKIMLERQLNQAKRDLFKVGTIKELKVIQDRIRYLNERIKELENGKMNDK